MLDTSINDSGYLRRVGRGCTTVTISGEAARDWSPGIARDNAGAQGAVGADLSQAAHIGSISRTRFLVIGTTRRWGRARWCRGRGGENGGGAARESWVAEAQARRGRGHWCSCRRPVLPYRVAESIYICNNGHHRKIKLNDNLMKLVLLNSYEPFCSHTGAP
jgi:hypothetical protein